MRFTKSTTNKLVEIIEKLERFFAYRYEVKKEDVVIMFHRQHFHVLIDGKLKETNRITTIENFCMDDSNGIIKRK